MAALRGDYHLTELAGADLIMSIHPSSQEIFVAQDLPREERIGQPVPRDGDRAAAHDAGVRAGVRAGRHDAGDFIGFGATQRTLGQFSEVGWKLMENYR